MMCRYFSYVVSALFHDEDIFSNKASKERNKIIVILIV